LNFRAARGAVQTLNMGQAEIHAAGLRAMRMEEGPIEGTEALRSVLDSQREAGLRFIALVDAEGEVLLSVGEPVEGEGSGVIYQPEAPTGVPRLAVVADRVRAFVPAPPERAVLSPFQQGRTPSRVTVRFRPRYYVLEFEPVPASNVVAQATRSFFLSCIGAALLTLIAVGFWRVSRRYEAAQRQIESQKRLSQLGEMSAVLAHEIRNPLASLKGNAQLLAESLTEDARMKRRADRVVGEAIRLETLTADLLDFARSVPVTRTLVDPGELVRATAEEVAPGRVVVELSGAPELWPLDRDKLHQALANLIRNACQIMDDGPTPIVAVLVENGQLVFTVRDFGPGVEAVNRERIFEPFFTTRTQGTGLGLPVAKRIAELHGGSIRAESHPEGGAVFRITLPDAQR
jgi:two-component system sensor histidine kinase HydH